MRASGKNIRLEEATKPALEVLGPLPAPMPRRAGYQRQQLILSSPSRKVLHAALDALMPALYGSPAARKLRWSLDVDPMDLY